MAENLKKKFEAIANFTIENHLSFKEIIEELEQNLIKIALKNTEFNKSKAAELLKMHRNTFNFKVKKYKIKRETK